MGTAMGGAAINTAFGGQGADKLLVRITTVLAVTFMSLALIIGIMNPASTSVEGLPTGNSSGTAQTSLSEDAFDSNPTATEASNNKNEKSIPGNLKKTLNGEKESVTKGEAE